MLELPERLGLDLAELPEGLLGCVPHALQQALRAKLAVDGPRGEVESIGPCRSASLQEGAGEVVGIEERPGHGSAHPSTHP